MPDLSFDSGLDIGPYMRQLRRVEHETSRSAKNIERMMTIKFAMKVGNIGIGFLKNAIDGVKETSLEAQMAIDGMGDSSGTVMDAIGRQAAMAYNTAKPYLVKLGSLYEDLSTVNMTQMNIIGGLLRNPSAILSQEGRSKLFFESVASASAANNLDRENALSAKNAKVYKELADERARIYRETGRLEMDTYDQRRDAADQEYEDRVAKLNEIAKTGVRVEADIAAAGERRDAKIQAIDTEQARSVYEADQTAFEKIMEAEEARQKLIKDRAHADAEFGFDTEDRMIAIRRLRGGLANKEYDLMELELRTRRQIYAIEHDQTLSTKQKVKMQAELNDLKDLEADAINNQSPGRGSSRLLGGVVFGAGQSSLVAQVFGGGGVTGPQQTAQKSAKHLERIDKNIADMARNRAVAVYG